MFYPKPRIKQIRETPTIKTKNQNSLSDAGGVQGSVQFHEESRFPDTTMDPMYASVSKHCATVRNLIHFNRCISMSVL